MSAFLPLAGERVVSMLYGAFKIAAFKLLLLSWAAITFPFVLFRAVEGGGEGQSRELGARALPSGGYPAGKLQ